MAVLMQARYAGELHCELLHTPSGAALETDAPVDNEGRGACFSPTDLVGAALLSCALTTMAIKARREAIPFERAEGSVSKHMSSHGPRRIERLTLLIRLSARTSPEHRARLTEIAATCPVALSLSPELQQDLHIHFNL